MNSDHRGTKNVATFSSRLTLAGRWASVASIALALAWLPQQSRAASAYWDANGSAAGAGGPTPAGTWGTDNFWSTSSAGTAATGAWISGDTAIFSAGTDASGTFTVNLNGTQTAGGVTFEDGTLTLSSGTLFLNGGANIVANAGRSATISSIIDGSGWSKQGGGVLALTGANTFTGPLTLTGGTLRFDNNSAAGPGSIVVSPTADVFIQNSIAATTLGNSLVLNAGNNLDVSALSGTLTLNGAISGTRTLWTIGGQAANTVVLGGNSSFSGNLKVLGGTLIITANNSLGTIAGTTEIAAGATLGVQGGFAYTTAEDIKLNGDGVGSAGAIRNVSGVNTLSGPVDLLTSATVGATAGSLELAGTINGPAFNLTKVGSGRIIVSGLGNNWNNTTISGGTLRVDTDLGTGSVIVGAGTTLAGAGNVPGSVTLSGTISPGASPDAITTGPETWNAGASYTWEINDADFGSPGSGTGWDLVDIANGAKTLTISPMAPGAFTITITSLDPIFNLPGQPAGDFDNTTDYDFLIANAPGGISGFAANKFTLNTANFINDMSPQGLFLLQTENSGKELHLLFRRTPNITVQPVAQLNKQCSVDSATFTVTATGSAVLHYQWYHGATPIGPDSPTLTISPVSTADGGLYHVVVTNPYGTATSSDAALTVIDTIQPVLTPCPANILVYSAVPTAVSFACPTATDSCDGPLTVTCVPASGSTFPVGTTLVTATATDSHANTSSCSFYVTVCGPNPLQVYVDDNYVGKPPGTLVNFPDNGATGPHVIGCDAFATIQLGINNAGSGGTVNVAAGTYPEAILIDKSLGLVGAQAGQNANVRFAAFTPTGNGPKANPLVESIITAAATAPTSAANDTLHIKADNVTIDGFVVDGNNPALAQGGAAVIGGINTDARRAIETEDAAGNFFSANGAQIKNNVIQNFFQRGIELINPTDTSPPTSGSLITGNVIRNFGLDGIALWFNAYSDVTFNTIDMVAGSEAGIWMQDFPLSGATPKTVDISHNTVTVCQDAFGGIWANLCYGSDTTINIHDNTVNAAAGVTGTDDFTFGIYCSSLQGGTTAHLANNVVGASGGQFARGIALWNVPSTVTPTLTGDSVGNSVKGISVHYADPSFLGAGSSYTVNASGVSVTGTDVGVFVEAVSSGANTVRMDISGNSAIHGCTSGISVLGAKASANIHDNLASITGNAVGIDVDGGKAKLQSNTITNNSTAGIRVQNGAIVDAGDCSGSNLTGMGSSTGGNNLSGYGFDDAAPWAIRNLNASPDVYAQKNNFGAGGSAKDIRLVLFDIKDDGSKSTVHASDSVVQITCPPSPASVQCVAGIQAAATTVDGFYALGGASSSTEGTLGHSDSASVPGPNNGNVTRHYSLTDPCGLATGCDQLLPVLDTINPVAVCQPFATSLNGVQSSVSILPSDVFSPSSSDNCGVVSPISVTPNTFYCGGAYNVTLTVSDGNGNTGTCVAVVTVTDNRAAPGLVYVDDNYVGLPNGTSVAFPAGVGPATHLIGCDAFATVQGGVNRVAAAGTVNVAAGLYSENVVVSKPITLLGANANVDPRLNACRSGPARGPEAIIDGGGFDATVALLESHVTVNGFTLRGGGFVNNNFNSGVWIYAGVTDDHVLNNIITANDAGVSVSCSGASSIRTNLITANNGTDVAGGIGILGYANTTNLTIADNEISGNTEGNPINLQASGADTHVGVVITRNSIHDSPGLAAVYLFGTTGGTVTRNQVEASGATCLSVSGANKNLLVTDNFFSNADRGVRVNDAFSVGSNSNIGIYSNSFNGFTLVAATKYAVGNEGGLTDSVLDASANWWGSSTPAGVTGVIDTTGGPVDYTPWLDTGVETVVNVCDGFNGDLSVLHVDDNSPQAGSGGRIQEGINLIADGSLTGGNRILDVEPGTYSEVLDYRAIWVNKPLKLIGTGGAAVTTINGSVIYMVLIDASNVTMDGFTVTDPTYSTGGFGGDGTGIYVNWVTALSNVHVKNCVVHDLGDRIAGFSCGSGPNLEIDHCTVYNIKGYGPQNPGYDDYNDFSVGIWVWDDGLVSANVHDNIIHDIYPRALSVGVNISYNVANAVVALNQITLDPACTAGVRLGSSLLGGPNSVSKNTVSGSSNGLLLLSPFAQTASTNIVSGAATSIFVGNSAATLLGNSASVGSGIGIWVSGPTAKARIEGNTLTGDSVAGIKVDGGATADAGQCTPSSDVTGLGISAGGNNLSGYGFDNAAPFAIDDANTTGQPDVLAYNNNFGAQPNIKDLIHDVVDTAGLTTVKYSQSGALYLSCPGPVGVQCVSGVPAAATTLAGFLAQGGVASSTAASVSSSDSSVHSSVNDQVITRHYVLTDSCGNTSSCDQTITVDDTIAPSITTWPADRTVVANASCLGSVPDLTGDVVGSDNCGVIHVSQNPVAGTLLGPGGPYAVLVTVSDDGGNSVAQNTMITVLPSVPQPATTFVDDDYVGLPTGTVVLWPAGTGTGPHYIGCDAFATITGGLNRVSNPGTVKVAPGTYNENIVVDKLVNLLGAKIGVDARGRVVGVPNPAVESIIIPAVPTTRTLELRTGCAFGVIDGFVFSGGSRAIESTTGPLDKMQIINNHFTGFTGSALFLNDNAIDMTIAQNVMNGSSQTSGDVLHLDTDTFQGLHVELNWIMNGQTGVFCDGNRNWKPSVNRSPTFSQNLVANNVTGANLGKRAFDTGEISLNTFTNNGFDGLQGSPKDSLIVSNLFINNGRWGLALTSFLDTGLGKGATNDTVSCNTFQGNGFVVAGGSGGLLLSATQPVGNNGSHRINYNNFINNKTGAVYTATEVVNMTNNWWNAASGPTIASNPGGTGDQILGLTIVYNPFLTSDNSFPAIQCPPNIVVGNDSGLCTAVVNFTVNASSGCCGGALTAGSTPPSGFAFPVGVTTVTSSATNACGKVSTCSFTVTVNDTQAPVISAVAAVETQPIVGAVSVKNCANTTVQGTVNIAVQASDQCPLNPPTVNLTNGVNVATATFVNQSPPGTFNYTWVVGPGTANGTWTATVRASDTATSTTSTFTLCVDVGQITGQIQLEGFVGTGTVPLHTRTVVFVATDGPGAGANVLKTWTIPVSNVSGDTFAYTLTTVPAGTLGLSAKTAWTKRSKLPVTLDINNQATGVNFTGAKQLRGGDLQGDNIINFLDYSILGNNFFTFNAVADITGDGQVNLDDYFVLTSNWFTTGDPQ